MSLSKEEWGHVSSTTSVNSDPGDSDLVVFAKRCLRNANADVDNVFLDLADLERQVAVKMLELELALAAQVQAHSNMPSMPALSYVNLCNAINLDIELELDVNPQPPATVQTVTTFAATPNAVAASTAILAAASPRRPTILVPRASRPVPNLLPVKPAMESATRPAGRKPSKGDVPTTSADSALLNTTT